MKSKMILVVSSLRKEENGKRGRINCCVPTMQGTVYALGGYRVMNRDNLLFFTCWDYSGMDDLKIGVT